MALRTPIIAIVGRPNVGKSTMFNRVLKEKRAVVEDIPGVTRDRNYALVTHYEFPFHLVDTGGFDADANDELSHHIREQALLAAQEADIVVVLFDAKAGLHPGDREVVSLLRQYNKPVFYFVNKCDGVEHEYLVSEFYSLGVDEVYPVSALHGYRVTELLSMLLGSLDRYDALCAAAEAQKRREEEIAAQVRQAIIEAEKAANDEDELQELVSVEVPVEDTNADPQFAPVYVPGESSQSPDDYIKSYRVRSLGNILVEETPEEEFESISEVEPIPCIRIALVGRPNAGKSTLLNTLVGEQRAITSDIAGTTRDSLELTVTRDSQEYTLIDTAGLRKKARVSDTVERYSTMRSLRAITDCDVAVVMIDAVRGPSEQDAKIVGLAHQEGKGIVIAVNKWDLIEKNHKSVQEFKEKIRDAFRFSPYAPLIFISALSGKRCPKVIETVREVAYSRAQMVPTHRLNKVLQRAMQKNSPPVARGRRIRLYYATQVASCPPRFLLFFNYPESVHFSYLRYLKNAIRGVWPFEGSDLKIVCKKRKNEQRNTSRRKKK